MPRTSEDPKASCSPIVGMGRLGPTTLLRVTSVETVEAPARMPAQGGASTPSRGGREGIGETGVSRRPEANRRMPHVCTIPTVENRKNTLKPSTAATCVRDNLCGFFKQANDAMAALPPPAEDMGLGWSLNAKKR
jgi:hypothetical protein